MSIYSDDYMPREGELNNNMRNFDTDRIILFDETKVYNVLIKNNMFDIYSNSYLVVLQNGGMI